MASKKFYRFLERLGAVGPEQLPLREEKPEVFQRFDLNLEAMINIEKEEAKKLNLPGAGKTLRKELLSKGYSVLESNSSYCGVPESIIVSGEFGMNHKEDFYNIASSLGLNFSSGPYYTGKISIFKQAHGSI